MQINKEKENIRLTNYMNVKDNKSINNTFSKTYRNNHQKIKNNNPYNKNIHIIMNVKIYIKKIKERNSQKKKTNKTEITLNGDSYSSEKFIKKFLNMSEFKENNKTIEFNDKSIDKSKNKIHNDKLNIGLNHNELSNNYTSAIKTKNDSINKKINILLIK